MAHFLHSPDLGTWKFTHNLRSKGLVHLSLVIAGSCQRNHQVEDVAVGSGSDQGYMSGTQGEILRPHPVGHVCTPTLKATSCAATPPEVFPHF